MPKVIFLFPLALFLSWVTHLLVKYVPRLWRKPLFKRCKRCSSMLGHNLIDKHGVCDWCNDPTYHTNEF